jgi:tetratricopeptide (TPR) repeat protein
LSASLWAERAQLHAAQGHLDQAIDDSAQAALACWNDPNLAALVRRDAAFREQALDEILKSRSQSPFDWRSGPYIWRDRGRERASAGDWAGAVREFAASATEMLSIRGPDLLAYACLLRLAGNDDEASRLAGELRGLPELLPAYYKPDGTPAANHFMRAVMMIRLLEDPPHDPVELVQRAEAYPAFFRTERAYVVGVALLRTGRLDEAVHRFEESLAIDPEWWDYGLSLYGLALAHHRLGHPDEARRWLDKAERWLTERDRMYANMTQAQIDWRQVRLSFESWVYAQVLRRETAGPILDASFPSDPLAQ